jgi:long-chain acyl-CoA synthetase
MPLSTTITRRAKQEDPNDPYSPYFSEYVNQNFSSTGLEDCHSLWDLFNKAVEKHGQKSCIGSRPIIRKLIEEEDGKILIKKDFKNEFEFITYDDTFEKVNQLASGLSLLGLSRKERLTIMMDTRMEFFLASAAAFKLGASIATVYSNLGMKGVIHCLNELQATILVTSNDNLRLIQEILPELEFLRKIIVVQDVVGERREGLLCKNLKGVEVVSFHNVYQNVIITPDHPSKSDEIAIIMYTSGSTGTPKGVLIPNESVLSIVSYMIREHGKLYETEDNAAYAAYLPMAHILEFFVVFFHIFIGVKVGFSGPQSVSGNPSGFIDPTSNLPDVLILKPSFMTAVPLTMDRIRANVKSYCDSIGVEHKNEEKPLPRHVVQWFLKSMGGRLKRIMVGGGRFSELSHKFASLSLGLQVTTNYGSTEICGHGTMSSVGDIDKFGSVGMPLGSMIKLIDCPELGYSPRDKPFPRGELLISGPIAHGYFRNSKITEENFIIDNEGRRWWKSGDIARVDAQGYFDIIDRKKDLVKPPRGEYISPAAIEAELKASPFVRNICIVARSDKDFVIALVQPDRKEIKALGKTLGFFDYSFKELCRNGTVLREVRQDFCSILINSKMPSISIPRRIMLCWEEWTSDSGLITTLSKINRRKISQYYQYDVETLFYEDSQEF